jgi:RNA polymerase sigma factor (sigma-70 family)
MIELHRAAVVPDRRERTRASRPAAAPGGVPALRFRSVNAGELEAFRRREPGAVRALYREYGRLVYAVAHRVLGRHDLAEDAVQQTFVRAWQAADRFDVERDPAAWLATIARRTAIDVHRGEARRAATALDDVPANDAPVVVLPPDLGALDAVWRVRRAIDELPTDEAVVVRLQHLDGMTHSEIADKLGVALGTVKSRSHRAHQKLAALLGHLREPIA